MIKNKPLKKITNSGIIEDGNLCPFSDKCQFKSKACNGEGCPVSGNKPYIKDFSCGLARAYNTFK